MVSSNYLLKYRLTTRREFLWPLILLAAWKTTELGGAQAELAHEEEFRLADLTSLQTLLTSNNRFYVRNHFAAPQLSAAEWRLQIAGQVRNAFGLNYPELLRLPSRTITATLECAGNGVGLGGVSTASWTGVPLADLLRRAGLRPGVKQIRLVGADRGKEASPALPFARSLSVEKALHPDTLLAFMMNGETLPGVHGYPVRAIVPGWYGMDSVKWLVRIEALDREDSSLFMTRRYVATRLQTIGTDQSPLTTMRVKSLIIQPRDGEILPVTPCVIRGEAWAGESLVAKVEVSTNGGADWSTASFDTAQHPYTWVQWSYSWEVKSPGSYVLVARATDEKGNTQPAARDPQRLDSYELNGYHSVRCEVR